MNSFRSISSVTHHHCLCIELTSTSFYRGSVDLYAFTGNRNLILSHNFHVCHDEENMSSSSKVYLSYVDRLQIPRNCHGTDVRHLAYRCNANDNYCFQSMRVRRCPSLGITMCWPLYRNNCRIQDDRFCGDHLLKINREIFINAIPTREFGQFKVDSCLLMRPRSNMEKQRCDKGGGVHIILYGIKRTCLESRIYHC